MNNIIMLGWNKTYVTIIRATLRVIADERYQYRKHNLACSKDSQIYANVDCPVKRATENFQKYLAYVLLKVLLSNLGPSEKHLDQQPNLKTNHNLIQNP